MTTTRDYPPFWVLAGCIGFGCIAVDLVSNTEFIYEQTGSLVDSSVAAVVAVGIGGAIALSASMKAFRNGGPIIGTMLFIGYIAAAVFSLSATLDRVATQRDNKLERIWSQDKEIQRLTKVRDKMEYNAIREATEGRRDRRGRRISPAGKGAAYDAAKAEAKIANDLIVKRKAELDSLGRRISGMTVGLVTIEQASKYQPCILPVALLLLGQWLVAFCLNGRKIKPEFNTELTGRAALVAKAERYAAAFKASHGRLPRQTELQNELGVTVAVARNLRKNIAA